ncbi:MAG: DUF4215 domain-containing protein [Deltaproteobacteria bacterium]|nr:DUF4215 domain-containing protein [Deltaproteobacteria bacterium]
MDIWKRFLSLVLWALILPLPVALATGSLDDDDDDGRNRDKKVKICHFNPNDPRQYQTIEVPRSTLKRHIEHGDFLGSCIDDTGNIPICFVPADNPNGAYDMTVGEKSLEAFLLYGSYTGRCSDGGTNKVKICHIPPGNPRNAHTIVIDRSALNVHLNRHGDYLGPCKPRGDDNECDDDDDGDQCKYYWICYRPYGKNGGTSMRVQANKLLKRLRQGSYLGHCRNQPTTPAPETATTAAPTTTRPGGDPDITICHIPPGAPENAHEITISIFAARAHVLHGDYPGRCNTTNTLCGNGIVDLGEECDTVTESKTCNADCTRPRCGDRIVNRPAGEHCDAGEITNSSYCLTNCKWARCGDGFLRVGIEECDTGGFSATCNNDCTLTKCGDGILNTAAGEQCDDGNTVSGDGCSSTCQLEGTCGNGCVEAGEECDLGSNNSATGYCTSNCKLSSCGDKLVNPAYEECDDGNTDNTDGCLNDCRKASCGDGVVQFGVEQCDYGISNNTGYCNSNCKLNTCGDALVRTDTEECDQGDQNNNTAFCTRGCKRNICGDGFVYRGVEECDTGFLSYTGSCLPGCKKAFCGDGYVQAGVENCDDGPDNGKGHGYCKYDCSKVEDHTGKIVGIVIGSAAGLGILIGLIVKAAQVCQLRDGSAVATQQASD